MDFLSRMTRAMDYIEDNITEDIMYDDVAKIVCCSMYQFGRVFSYVVGVSLSEYIRRRRLTLAALDLGQGDAKVIDVALKYGYNSPDSFARAFQSMHAVTPKEACALGVKLKLYPRITFHISIKGDADMEYRIEKKESFTIVGVVKNLGKWSVNKNADNWQDAHGDLWKAWDEYLNGGMNEHIRDDYKLYRAPMWQVGCTQTLDNGETLLAIGAESDGKKYDDLQSHVVPANTWAVFTVRGKFCGKEHPVDAMFTRIASEWLPASGYKRAGNYDLDVYGPTCEIWMPVVKR